MAASPQSRVRPVWINGAGNSPSTRCYRVPRWGRQHRPAAPYRGWLRAVARAASAPPAVTSEYV